MEAGLRAGRLGLAWLAVMATLLALFVAGELPEPSSTVRAATAVLGVAMLTVDAVLPVASSAVMVLLGAVYGSALGTVLATLGGLGALVVGGSIGRAGRRRMHAFLGPERPRAEALIERYGAFAVVVSRPVPLLAESVVILAAATGMPWRRLLLAGVAGVIPVAFVLAFLGARGAQASGAG